MCGIAGILHYNRSEEVQADVLAAMRDTMVHRGPDDLGQYISADKRCGLAHRRLSIIDLSALARQPMSDDSGRYWITFNGEIYNFAELRSELETDGVRFRSHSDTEVLLYLYRRHGKNMLHLLRGMFAFAIYDAADGSLFLARDRIGVKPLYYSDRGGAFVFASEIKAILRSGLVPRRVHGEALYHYMSFLTTPAPQTLFEGISKLPAAHCLHVARDGRIKIDQWWTPLPAAMEEMDEAAVVDRIRDLLRTSIRYRMVSDVPFGVFLSGGVDSSTNVALMAEMMDRPVETFSIAFRGESAFNEFDYAKQVSDRFGTKHHEVQIGMSDLMEFLPSLIFHQDEPIADPVCVPVYYVAKLAKDNGVTVCQVGEGSDELFCGYPHWGLILGLDTTERLYSLVPKPLKRLTSFFAQQLQGPDSAKREYIRRASYGEPLFWGGAEAFFEAHKRRLLRPEFLTRLRDVHSANVIAHYFQEYVQASPQPDRLGWMTYMDLKLRLPELLLMRIDKMTMATSVEARVPFLDHKLVEFVMSLPQSRKMPGKELKHLLKKAVRGVIPDTIIDRPKQGFGVPIVEYFQRELGERIRTDLLQFCKLHPYFDSAAMESLLHTSNGALPWYLFNFVLWHRTWIEERKVA